jgi:hypothetical protein
MNSKITILNKIKFKPLLMDTIFSFAENRPFIFPYMIDIDPILKKSLKLSIEPINKKNNLSNDLNDNISTFISFRLLYEKAKETLLEQIKSNFIKEYEENRLKIDLNKNKSFSFIRFFAESIMKQIEKVEIPKDININYYEILSNLPKKGQLFEFVSDYLSIKNEIMFFYLPPSFIKIKKKEILV